MRGAGFEIRCATVSAMELERGLASDFQRCEGLAGRASVLVGGGVADTFQVLEDDLAGQDRFEPGGTRGCRSRRSLCGSMGMSSGAARSADGASRGAGGKRAISRLQLEIMGDVFVR
jgi:hypothetical protein